MKRPRRSAAPRRASFFVSVLLALLTTCGLVSARSAPATALAMLSANAGAGETSVRKPTRHETAKAFESRSAEVRTIGRSPKAADRSRSARTREGAVTPLRLAVSTDIDAPPPARGAASSGAGAWTRWEAPGRARARLMVFLN